VITAESRAIVLCYSESQRWIKLLEFEKKAEDLVNQARRVKAQKVKQARDEADQEIHDYRQQREAQYQSYAKQHTGDKDEYTRKLKDETDEEITIIHKQAEENGKAVVDLLLKFITDVHTQMPERVVAK